MQRLLRSCRVRCPVQPRACCLTPAHDTGDAYTDELIEQILENYTFKCEPEVRLKLRHK